MKLGFGVTIAIFASTVLSLVPSNRCGDRTNAREKRNVGTLNWAGAAIPAPPDGSTFATVIASMLTNSSSPSGDSVTLEQQFAARRFFFFLCSRVSDPLIYRVYQILDWLAT